MQEEFIELDFVMDRKEKKRHNYINDIFVSGRGRKLKDENQEVENSDVSEKKLKAERQGSLLN